MMKRSAIFVAALLVIRIVPAKDLEVAHLNTSILHLKGSQCEFAEQGVTVLAGDWVSRFWMKIDGKLVEFRSTRSDADIERQLESKRWREVLKTGNLTVILDLTETGGGEDSAAFQGRIDVSRDKSIKRLAVAGGCGA